MNSAFATFTDCIATPLAAVESLFDEELVSRLSSVNELVKHVANFRGKMLRPRLVLLSGKACGELTKEHIILATVMEMVHMSTLVHDDVLDEAELRRRGSTINRLRGNEAAVLLGDYLISHSYHLCSQLDSSAVARVIGETTNKVCEGELLQLDNRNNLELSEATYLDIITHKTAVLTASCCRLGAQLSNGSEQQIRQLEEYGLALGIAFQIQDDILDLTGQVEQVGKTLGTDIAKGKMTLPMIHFLRTAPREHRRLLKSLMSSEDADKAERVRNLILPSRSMQYAQDRARHYVDHAKECLAEIGESESRTILEMMAGIVVSRNN